MFNDCGGIVLRPAPERTRQQLRNDIQQSSIQENLVERTGAHRSLSPMGTASTERHRVAQNMYIE